MCDNNHGETIKVIEKEIGCLKGKLVNTNQLLSNLRNKNSTCFLQGDAFPRKPTEGSNENIDFAVDTLLQCLIIPLNSTNCDEGHDILKTKLDEQLKEIRKCHHQKYLNTILKLALNINLIVKSQKTKKYNLLEKQIHVRNIHQGNQQTFTKFREIFTIVKMIIVNKIN